jgi:hypothetical protein
MRVASPSKTQNWQFPGVDTLEFGFVRYHLLRAYVFDGFL